MNNIARDFIGVVVTIAMILLVFGSGWIVGHRTYQQVESKIDTTYIHDSITKIVKTDPIIIRRQSIKYDTIYKAIQAIPEPLQVGVYESVVDDSLVRITHTFATATPPVWDSCKYTLFPREIVAKSVELYKPPIQLSIWHVYGGGLIGKSSITPMLSLQYNNWLGSIGYQIGGAQGIRIGLQKQFK